MVLEIFFTRENEMSFRGNKAKVVCTFQKQYFWGGNIIKFRSQKSEVPDVSGTMAHFD